MICQKEGAGMQKIAKILNNISILALSATINDTDKLLEWFKNISPNLQIEKIICNKRFFNLQKYYYNSELNDLITIHPLSLIHEEYIKDKEIWLVEVEGRG
jgi:superfamily II RNA helicase